jgi:hypothetical protein
METRRRILFRGRPDRGTDPGPTPDPVVFLNRTRRGFLTAGLVTVPITNNSLARLLRKDEVHIPETGRTEGGPVSAAATRIIGPPDEGSPWKKNPSFGGTDGSLPDRPSGGKSTGTPDLPTMLRATEKTRGRTDPVLPGTPGKTIRPPLLPAGRTNGTPDMPRMLRDTKKTRGRTDPVLSGTPGKTIRPLLLPAGRTNGTPDMPGISLRIKSDRKKHFGNHRPADRPLSGKDLENSQGQDINPPTENCLPDNPENRARLLAAEKVPTKTIPTTLKGVGHVSFPFHNGSHNPADRISCHSRRMGTDRKGPRRSSLF